MNEIRQKINLGSFPEQLKKQIKPNDMVIRVRSLTTDYLPEKWLNELAKDSVNQRVLWRHRDPVDKDNPGPAFGRVLDAQVEDYVDEKGVAKKAIYSHYRIFGDRENEQKLQKAIKLRHERGDEMGVSKGFTKHTNKNGDIYRVFSLEDSITYIPECKQCKTQEVIEMEDKEKKALETQILKLQEELNNSKITLEDKDKALTEATAVVEKLSADKEAEVEAGKSEKQLLEDKLVALNDTIHKLEGNINQLERKPYLDELKKLDTELVYNVFKERPIKEIQARITEVSKAKAAVTTTTLAEEVEMEEGVKPLGSSVFRNNPELQAEIARLEKGES